MMAPPTILDNIVVHELAHLIFPNYTEVCRNEVEKVTNVGEHLPGHDSPDGPILPQMAARSQQVARHFFPFTRCGSPVVYG